MRFDDGSIDQEHYEVMDTLRAHYYDVRKKGSKPNDPGWHQCRCGNWEGYWSGWHEHVASDLLEHLTVHDGRISHQRWAEGANAAYQGVITRQNLADVLTTNPHPLPRGSRA